MNREITKILLGATCAYLTFVRAPPFVFCNVGIAPRNGRDDATMLADFAVGKTVFVNWSRDEQAFVAETI